MKTKKSRVHLIFAIVHSSLALVTLVPNAGASKASRLGYKALCSFAPYGTLILLALGITHIVLYKRALAKQ